MKNLTFLVALFFMGWTATASATINYPRFNNYNESFIFVEGGVEFAVYPNGEFDFFFDPSFARTSSLHVSVPGVNITYNSGYNYEAYVQYDDYGAIIQIENVPVYYDYYGRLAQTGNIFISYNRFGNIERIGNLHVRYDRFHQPVRYIGFINHYNRHYVYRPWHDYYRRPHMDFRVVFNQPYRMYYEPYRMSYTQYVNHYQVNNIYINKNNFYRPGQQVTSYNHGRRTTSRREIAPVRSSENVSRRNASTSDVSKGNYNRNSSVTRSEDNRGRRVVDQRTENKRQEYSASGNERGRSVTSENNGRKYTVESRNERVSSPANTNRRTERETVRSRGNESQERMSRTGTYHRKSVSNHRSATPQKSTTVQRETRSATAQRPQRQSRSTDTRVRQASNDKNGQTAVRSSRGRGNNNGGIE